LNKESKLKLKIYGLLWYEYDLLENILIKSSFEIEFEPICFFIA